MYNLIRTSYEKLKELDFKTNSKVTLFNGYCIYQKDLFTFEKKIETELYFYLSGENYCLELFF